MKYVAPEIVSPWRLTLPLAHALDVVVKHEGNYAAAARDAGLTDGGLRTAVQRARQRICEVGGFAPQDLTASATLVLWKAWRSRQWTETLAA